MKQTFLQRMVSVLKNTFSHEKKEAIPAPEKMAINRSAAPVNISDAGSDRHFALNPHQLKVKEKNRKRNKIASHSRAVNAR